ncbi:MAG: hypothetical protein ACNYPI_01630 [Arenicellales bacterium WSBS_2016_MAG_OTU3]
MKKVKPIQAGLIAAVLLASVSTSALANPSGWYDPDHWAPYDTAIEYFFSCTIFQQCVGSKWR